MTTTFRRAETCPNCGDPIILHSWDGLVSCYKAQEAKRKKEEGKERPKVRFNGRVG